MRAQACLLLMLSLACACKPKAASPKAAVPEVAFAGCVEIVNDVCLLDEPRLLRFWVPGIVEHLQATTDVGAASLEAYGVQGGTAIAVHVPDGVASLRVSTKEVPLVQMKLRSWTEPQVLADARISAKTDLQAAQSLLEKALKAAKGETAARIRSLLGRIHMQAGRYDEALALLEASAKDYVDLNQPFAASKDKIAMSFIASTRRSDAKVALQLLAQAGAVDLRARDLRAEIDYQRGVVEGMVGNVRGALVFVKQALVWAQRLGSATLEVAAQQWMAMTLSSLGRVDEALAMQLQIVSGGSANPCVRAPVLATAAWLSLLQKPVDAEQTETRLRDARQALEACPDPFRSRNQSLNEISFFLARGRLDETERALRDLHVSDQGRTGGLSVLELELQGRLALAQRHARRALQSFEHAETLATAAGLGDEALRMHVWQAQALADNGQPRAAIRLLEQAEDILDQRLQLVPVGEGRVRFVQMRDQGVRTLVNLHLLAGDAKKAFDAARRGRSRALRGLALGEQLAGLRGQAKAKWLSDIAEYQRLRDNAEEYSDAWALSQSELTTQAELTAERNKRAQEALDKAYVNLVGSLPGEGALPALHLSQGDLALLFVKEHDADGTDMRWRGFAASADQVRTSLVTAPSSGLQEHPWFVPFAGAIESARRIRVLFTDVATEELHAATFKQKPLQNHAPVAYSLDIASAPSALGRPLVVADPTEDLPAAHHEGREVAEMLKVGTDGRLLLGRASTRQAVMAMLPAAGWFHYAGHSVFGGEEGLDSGLPLAQRQRLLAADVLALAAVPEVVVLSSCEAGRSAGNSNTAGLGLAQAFVVAGAKVVIAPNRPVSDEISRVFMQRLYKHVSAGLPAERALQAAVSEANAQQESDWSTFRALVP